MKEKHQVHNLIILDESGSMNSIKEQIIQGFNEIVQTVKSVEEQYSAQEHYISFLTFNGLGITEHLFKAPVKELQEIDATAYKPAATTPLYDAIGFGLARLERILEDTAAYNVLVTIFTDGRENASREYTGAAIRAKIEELTSKGWTFTYTGTDHDVYRSAGSISIKNVIRFDRNDSAMEEMFRKEKEARYNYSKKINLNLDTTESFYGEDL